VCSKRCEGSVPRLFNPGAAMVSTPTALTLGAAVQICPQQRGAVRPGGAPEHWIDVRHERHRAGHRLYVCTEGPDRVPELHRQPGRLYRIVRSLPRRHSRATVAPVTHSYIFWSLSGWWKQGVAGTWQPRTDGHAAHPAGHADCDENHVRTLHCDLHPVFGGRDAVFDQLDWSQVFAR
jgi:hypothetical protein